MLSKFKFIKEKYLTFKESYKHNIDYKIAQWGLFFSVLLTIFLYIFIGRPVYLSIGIFSIISFLLYIYLVNPLSLSNINKNSTQNPRLYMYTNIVFFLLYALSIFALHFSFELYQRPISYFLLVSLMAIVVTIEIIWKNSNQNSNSSILFKIILIGISLEWSQILLYPSLLGMDPWWHQMFTNKILSSAYIPVNEGYSKLPMTHIYIGTTSLLTSLGYKFSSMLTISFCQIVLDCIFIFLICKFMFSEKIGLLASLLTVTSNYHIQFGYWSIPNTFGVTIVLIITYILFKNLNHTDEKSPMFLTRLFALFFMGILILTHTIAAMSFFVLLIIYWLSFYLYRIIHDGDTNSKIKLNLVAVFLVSMLGWWMFASGHIRSLAKIVSFGFKLDQMSTAISPDVLSYIETISSYQVFYNNLGTFLFFSFSFIGCLYIIKYGNKYSFMFMLGGVFILGLSFAGTITGHSIIQHRWWYLAEIILSIPLSVSLFLIYYSIKSENTRTITLTIFVGLICFLMISTPLTNIDNVLFSKSNQVRYSFTSAELYSMSTISNIAKNGNVYTDVYATYLNKDSSMNINLKSIQDEDMIVGNFQNYKKDYLLFRGIIAKNTFRVGGGPYRLQYDLFSQLNEPKYNLIYNSKSVIMYT